jgi:hypothetical protein
MGLQLFAAVCSLCAGSWSWLGAVKGESFVHQKEERL